MNDNQAPSASPPAQPTTAGAAAVPDVLALHAAAQPERAAVVVDGSGGATPSSTTFAALNVLVNEIANGLSARGIGAGDRVVWCGPNSLEVIAVIHAARKLGLVAVPLSYRFSAEEMAYVIDNSEAVAVLCDGEYAPLVESVRPNLASAQTFVAFGAPPSSAFASSAFASSAWSTLDELRAGQNVDEPGSPPNAAEAGAQMIYTSGTTGKPKGALRTRTDRDLVMQLLLELNLVHENAVHLTTGPLYHSGPLAFASLAHTMGAPIVVLRKFDALAWVRLVREHRVTNTFSAPTQLKRIVSLSSAELAEADLSSMVTLIANAAPVPYSLKQEIIAKLGDGFLYEVYGSTELGVDTVLKPADQLRKPGSCGRPYGNIRLRVALEDGTEAPAGEPGELFVSTTLAMDGYHRTDQQLTELAQPTDGSAPATAGQGWKSVGDIAYIDDEGYVHICDRKKDMIISGGVNIYPAEIESVLYAHPQVLDAAVFGIPDDEWGERVHAIVQPKVGESIDLEELRSFADERLGGYKRPRAYELRAELPRTDSGKLLKRVLRDEYWTDRDSRV